MIAFVQSYSQRQARLMFVTALGMDNFDCTKMKAHYKTPKTKCVLKVYKDKEFYQLGFPGLLTLKIQGSVPP